MVVMPRSGEAWHCVIVQLSVEPTDNFDFGLAYSLDYYAPDELVVSGETGSETANAPFGEDIATTADHLVLQGRYQISDRLNISVWGGVILNPILKVHFF